VNSKGVSLIEVMVALTILSTVLVALGGLMFQVGRHTRTSARQTYQAAALQQGAASIEALPWSAIDAAAGCTSDTTGLLEYSQCIAVADSGNTKFVTLIVTPTGTFVGAPDTVSVYRHKPRGASLLR
jgi:prepilin-type N-terminal cleavage/methylation domain-containing protein